MMVVVVVFGSVVGRVRRVVVVAGRATLVAGLVAVRVVTGIASVDGLADATTETAGAVAVVVVVVFVVDGARVLESMATSTPGDTFDERCSIVVTEEFVDGTTGVVDPVVVDAVIDVELGLVSEPAPATGEFCSTTTMESAATESPGLVTHQIVPPRSATHRAPTVAILDRDHLPVLSEADGV